MDEPIDVKRADGSNELFGRHPTLVRSVDRAEHQGIGVGPSLSVVAFEILGIPSIDLSLDDVLATQAGRIKWVAELLYPLGRWRARIAADLGIGRSTLYRRLRGRKRPARGAGCRSAADICLNLLSLGSSGPAAWSPPAFGRSLRLGASVPIGLGAARLRLAWTPAFTLRFLMQSDGKLD